MAPPKGTVGNPTGKGGPKKGEKRNPSGVTLDQAERRKTAREAIFSNDKRLIEAAIDLAVNDPKEGKGMLQYLVSVIIGKDADRVEFTDKTIRAAASGMSTDDALAFIRASERLRRESEEGTLGEGRALVSSGPKPDGAASGLMGKS